jgi:Putative auto-transporter adhesin, head GIN domain
VLRTMFLTRVKKTLTAVILALFLAAGIVLVGHTLTAAVPAQDKKAPRTEEARKEDPKKESLPIIRKIVISASGGVNLRQTGKESVNGVALKAEDLKDGVLELAGAEEVTVEVKELPELVVEGSGNVTGTDIKAKRAAITISGSGEVLLSGTADEQVVISVGSGGVNGRGLKGKQATISVDGSADVIVNVTDLLKASIGGSGSIRYCGAPRVEETVSGSGAVVPCTDKDK